VKDADENKAILKNLKDIEVNSQEECIAILKKFPISINVLCFLPKDDKNDINIEIANKILKLLVNFSENLFDNGDEKECNQFQSKF
jgi:hypothetical protein